MRLKPGTKVSLRNYLKGLSAVFSQVRATHASGATVSLERAADEAAREITAQRSRQGQVIIVGNGGSAAIASHTAVDLWKNAGVRAIAFNDPALLTCLSNDFGYAHVFSKPVKMFARDHDLLIAISSSGRSENILQAAAAARIKKCKVITLSGFQKDNPLRRCGDLYFYVPSASYGYVETVHAAICHFMIDRMISSGK